MLAEAKEVKITKDDQHNDELNVKALVQAAWQSIAPAWPLKDFIACNPLDGFQSIAFEEACANGQYYFQRPYPLPISAINRETIKWCQAYFDQGQASLKMPITQQGLYASWRELAQYDRKLHQSQQTLIRWIKNLPHHPEQAIATCLHALAIPKNQQTLFLTLLLTSLPGWAAYVKYRTAWATLADHKLFTVSQADYLAIRVAITAILWPEAKVLLDWSTTCSDQPIKLHQKIMKSEKEYEERLLPSLKRQHLTTRAQPIEAQFIFCIDTRSEPLRRALESVATVETFGCAGFFGLPIYRRNETNGDLQLSCPVLVEPAFTVNQPIVQSSSNAVMQIIHKIYQGLKYNFTTPFILADALGIFSSFKMLCNNFFPLVLKRFIANKIVRPASDDLTLLANIPLTDQCRYAEAILRMMGLTNHFAKVVVICGHGSQTTNNAYAAALQCGACAGHAGHLNAIVLSAILNQPSVRDFLKAKQINISNETLFIPALHDTTTDQCELLIDTPDTFHYQDVMNVQNIMHQSSAMARTQRQQLFAGVNGSQSPLRKAADWSETRPEWGLINNSAFIIAPRDLTKAIDLQGEVFLHSYDWQQDTDGTQLAAIMLGPLRVAHWINMQYLFSSLDNIAYGSGSKITQNVVSKIGVMQGNASDLMHGLPLQSIAVNDQTPIHQSRRLLAVIQAPREKILAIIQQHTVLRNLFLHGWCKLACLEPDDWQIYLLHRDLTWYEANV